jgi:hypothetical protein
MMGVALGLTPRGTCGTSRRRAPPLPSPPVRRRAGSAAVGAPDGGAPDDCTGGLDGEAPALGLEMRGVASVGFDLV